MPSLPAVPGLPEIDEDAVKAALKRPVSVLPGQEYINRINAKANAKYLNLLSGATEPEPGVAEQEPAPPAAAAEPEAASTSAAPEAVSAAAPSE